MHSWHKAWLVCLYFMKHDNSAGEMEQYFCNVVSVIEKANLVFQILVAESEILPFSELLCANLLCKGRMDYLCSSSEENRQRKVKGRRVIKKLKHEDGIISEWFGPQLCGTKLSITVSPAPKTAHSCLYAASSCSLVFMGTSILQSMPWNWTDPVQNSSPLPHFSFSFFILNQLLDLVHHMDHKLLNQHNWGWHAATWWQKCTPRGGGSKGRKG